MPREKPGESGENTSKSIKDSESLLKSERSMRRERVRKGGGGRDDDKNDYLTQNWGAVHISQVFPPFPPAQKKTFLTV